MIIVPDEPEEAGPEDVFRAEVQKVFDGDGFLAKIWNPLRECWVERVPFRFAFIDAPEKGQPFGDEARDYLIQLIHGKELRLDPVGKESSGYLPFDGYKRLLCMAFITERIEAGPLHYYHRGTLGQGTAKRARTVTRNIELEMIINGWAWVTVQYDFDRKEEYLDAQNDAQLAQRGLWAMDNPEAPWTFKRRQRQKADRSRNQGSLF